MFALTVASAIGALTVGGRAPPRRLRLARPRFFDVFL